MDLDPGKKLIFFMTFTNDVNFVLVPIQVCFLECNIFGIGQFWYFFFF